MPRGNYRTGASRDRRTRDSGGPPVPTPIAWGCKMESSNGPTTIEVDATPVSWADGTPLDIDIFRVTGQPTRALLFDATNAETLTPDSVELTAVAVRWTFTTSALSEEYTFVLPSYDAKVRGNDGSWLAALVLVNE